MSGHTVEPVSIGTEVYLEDPKSNGKSIDWILKKVKKARKLPLVSKNNFPALVDWKTLKEIPEK